MAGLVDNSGHLKDNRISKNFSSEAAGKEWVAEKKKEGYSCNNPTISAVEMGGFNVGSKDIRDYVVFCSIVEGRGQNQD